MHTLDTLLEQAGELPSLPEVYIRVTELLETETSSALQIGAAVQTDPALTARILKLINSAYYGLAFPVTSIPQALTLMGRDQLKQLLLGSVLSGVFKDFDISGFPLRPFWQHSIKTAIIARHLAMQNASIADHEAFFTAGLLHDIGWLIIARVEARAYQAIASEAEILGRDIVEIEQQTLGVSHIDVGVALLQDWNLPGLIVRCIKHHHEVDHEGPFAIETSIVYLANRLSRFTFEDPEVSLADGLADIPNWEQTRCTVEQVEIACGLAEDQWLDVMDSLGMLDLVIGDDNEDPFDFQTSYGRA